jgi:hypothetical protein
VGEQVAAQELNGALGVWRQVQIAPALKERRPQEVALLPDGSLRVRLEPGPLTVRLRPDGLEGSLRRLAAVAALRGSGLEDIEEVDLRFPDKVVVRPRPVAARPAASDRAPAAPRAAAGAVRDDLRPEPTRAEGRGAPVGPGGR